MPAQTALVPVDFSALSSVSDTWPVWHTAPLGELLERQVVADKDDAPLFSFAEFPDEEGKRVDARVVRVHHLVYDLDRATPQIDDFQISQLQERLAGLAGALYTTHRHGTDHPRWRLVLLLDRPLESAEYRDRWRQVVERYDLPIGDGKSRNESRAFYAPSCPAERQHLAQLIWLEGEPLKISSLPAWAAPGAPERPRAFAGVARAAAPVLKAPKPGRRNDELFRYACQMRRRGLEEGEILAVVAQRNAALREPLDDDELEQLCRSATRYEPDAALLEAQRKQDERVESGESLPALARGDHVEVGYLELARLGWRADAVEPIVVADQGRLYAYREQLGIWEPHTPEELRVQVYAYGGRDVQRPGLTKDGEPFAPRELQVTDRFAIGVVRVMMDVAHRPGHLAQQVPGVAFRDGFVEVQGGSATLCYHHPDHRAVHAHPFDFDPAPKTPLWDKFLADLQLSPEVVQYLHEYLGASMIGDVVRHKTACVLTGEGDNGKSVLLDVVRACFAPRSVVSIRPTDWAGRFTMASMVDARLNLVDEMPAGRILGTDTVKAIIGGAPTRTERKFEGSFDFQPKCGHVLAANELPRTLDLTQGFYTRWAVIPFTRTFARHEMDFDLREKLLAEVPQITSRIVLAAAALSGRRRLEAPEVVQQARDEWRSQSDHALRFAISLPKDPNASATTQELHRVYVRWAESEERVRPDEIVSVKALGWAMRRAGHATVNLPDGKPRAWHVKLPGPLSGLH